MPELPVLTARQFPRSHQLLTARSCLETPRDEEDFSPEKVDSGQAYAGFGIGVGVTKMLGSSSSNTPPGLFKV